jgi:hypothetical protein
MMWIEHDDQWTLDRVAAAMAPTASPETGIVASTNHANDQRVIERVVGAATGHEHPVFLCA